MNIAIKWLLIIIFTAAGLFATAAEKIVVTGRAAGKSKIAKEQALADALRQAVRRGAGVNIVSRSQSTNYILDFDRVFSRAFGYVKTFKILSSGLEETGLYQVKIEAIVDKGTPEINDYLSMRQIIAMKGSPRLLIRASGKISGVGNAKKLIDGQLREIALQCGFQTVKIEQFNAAEKQRARRDQQLGNNSSADYRNSDIRSKYDFIIDAEISGSYNGISKLYNLKTKRFSIGADLGASYPNGNVIAQVTLPSKETDIMRVSGTAQAARAAIQKRLGSNRGRNFRALLMRVLAAWVSEFDCGSRIIVELSGTNRIAFDRVIDGLRKAEGINSVNIREFDPELKSTIEVETGLKAYDLSKLISELSSEVLKTDHTTNDHIQMSYIPEPIIMDGTIKLKPSKSSILIASGITGLGILLVIFVLIFLRARKRD